MASDRFSPRGSSTGGGVGIFELGAEEMVGFEVGIVASDCRPAATVGLVAGTAVLTGFVAAAVTTGGDTGVESPLACGFEAETASGVLVERA